MEEVTQIPTDEALEHTEAIEVAEDAPEADIVVETVEEAIPETIE